MLGEKSVRFIGESESWKFYRGLIKTEQASSNLDQQSWNKDCSIEVAYDTVIEMSTVNVLRYTALGLGLWCGFRNDLFLRKSAAQRDEEKRYNDELELIREARREYTKLYPVQNSSSSGKLEDIKLDDPNLDFAQVILQAVDSLRTTS